MTLSALCSRVALATALLTGLPWGGNALAQDAPAQTGGGSKAIEVPSSSPLNTGGWAVVSTPSGPRLVRMSRGWTPRPSTTAPSSETAERSGGAGEETTAVVGTPSVPQQHDGGAGRVGRVSAVAGSAPAGALPRPTAVGDAWAPQDAPAGITVPAAPSDPVVQAAPGGGVQISWVDNSTNETTFHIQRQRQNGNTWHRSTTLLADANQTSLVDNPGNGTYRYRVRAANAAGSSEFTPWAMLQVIGQPPNAPSQVTLSDLGNGRDVRVAWVDNSSDETGFEIERERWTGSTWGNKQTLKSGPNQPSVTDAPGLGRFRYRVRAVSSGGASVFSPWAEVLVTQNAPAAPSNLQVSDQGNHWHVRVTWSDNSTNESHFEIQKQAQNGSQWGLLITNTLQAGTTSWVDSAGPGTYRYRVRAVNTFGQSAYTPWTVATVAGSVAQPPAAPTGVLASDVGNRRALVSWTDASDNETGFEIERSPSFAGGTVMVAANVSGYIDQCGPGTFSYRVRAVNASGASPYSAWASVTVAETAPAAPSGLVASANGNDSVTLSWTDNSNNESGFRIERQTEQAGGTWGSVTVLTAPANATTYNDTPGSGVHRYRIAATNFAGDSPFTGWVTASLTGGWTVFTPSTDTRIVYVSSSSGSDSNDGLSPATPKRTLAAGYAQLRNRYPDWLLLKRGDVWTDEALGGTPINGVPGTWQKSGRSATEMMVIGAYGEGPRPEIRSGIHPGIFLMSGDASRDHLAIVGIHFYAHRRDPSNAAFSSSAASQAPHGIQRYKDGVNFLIEDCVIRFYNNAINLQTGGTEGMRDVRIRRCIITDSYGVGNHSQGIYTEYVDGLLIEECLFDHCGWNETVSGAVATIYNHNMYIKQDVNRNITIRNNIVARGAATGIQCRPGGDVWGNLVLYNPTGISMGHAQVTWPQYRPSGRIVDNVILGGTDVNGDPRGRGINLERCADVTIENNIVAHLGTQNVNGSNVAGIRTAIEHENLTIRNNIIYKWARSGTGQGLSFNGTGGRNILIQNNKVQQMDGGYVVWHAPSGFSQYAYQQNTYFSSRSGSTWFNHAGTERSLSSWVGVSGETGASSSQVSFPNPQRTVETYMQSLGRPATLEAFLNEARQQSRTNWRSEFTARAVVNYVREGFGLPPL